MAVIWGCDRHLRRREGCRSSSDPRGGSGRGSQVSGSATLVVLGGRSLESRLDGVAVVAAPRQQPVEAMPPRPRLETPVAPLGLRDHAPRARDLVDRADLLLEQGAAAR